MIYKDFQGEKLSALGLGCMRLPTKEDGSIDEKTTAEMVEYSFAHGINYFDTAWGYHGGQSEIVMGNILNNYDRKSYNIATKFPGYDRENLKSRKQVEEIFQKQLEKTKKDYFDFYLFHNVNELNLNLFTSEEVGVHEYLIEMKKKGYIRHLGFSCHGQQDTLEKFYNTYKNDIEFCQIQLNYLDTHIQKADKKVEFLNNQNLPIWVMEPVRGGKLASLPEECNKMLKDAYPDSSIVSWAFRFIESLKGIGVVLSGMSNMDQLKENINIFDNIKPLDPNETALLDKVVSTMLKDNILPCVECRYCMEKCPLQLEIPKLLALYGEFKYTGGFIPPMMVSTMDESKRPYACLHCHSCEDVCPQNIKISDAMEDFCRLLDERKNKQ